MNKDKKIAMQERISHQLQEEVKSLLKRNTELEKQVNENKEIIKLANSYRDEHEKEMTEIRKVKEKYLQATEDIITYKKNYKKEMNGLLKIVKKNI